MYAGRIVEEGATDEVLATPLHPYTRRLIACVPELGGGRRELAAIPGLPPMVDRLPEGCAFAARCDKAQGACKAGELELFRAGDRAVRCLYPEEALA
jgi:peptide/nickel transport system permease protein